MRRPLIPVVLAFAAGLAAGAWDLEIPGPRLLAILAGLLVLFGILHWLSPPRG